MTTRESAVCANDPVILARERLHYAGLDLLRFAAALLVVLLHLAFWSWWPTGNGGTIQSAFGRLQAFPELQHIAWIGWVGVEIFFVISGFVIAYSASRSTATSFAIGRLVRLMPAVWICMTMGAIVLLLFGHLSLAEILTRWANSLIVSPYPFWIDGVLWSLSVEIIFYSVVWILLCLNAGRYIPDVMLFLGSASGLYSIAGLAGLFDDHVFILRLLLLEHGCYFSLGVLAYEIWISGKRSKRPQFWLMAVFCLAALWWTTKEKMASFGIVNGAFLPTVVWVIAMAWLLFSVSQPRWSEQMSPVAKHRLRNLGLMTYPLYLVHSLSGGVVLLLLMIPQIDRWLALAVSLSSVVAVSWLVAIHVEPSLQAWSKKRLFQAVRQRAAPDSDNARPLARLDS